MKTKEFRVEAARVGVVTKDGTRLITVDAQVGLRPGAFVAHAPQGMPEATQVVAELTGLDVEDGIVYLSGYGLPGVVEGLEARTVMIALDVDDLMMETWRSVLGIEPLVITKMTIRGGLLVTPAQYSWEV